MRDDEAAGVGPAIRFTDEEAAFLRHVRFGELPGRVLPADRQELTETEPRRYWPEPTVDSEVSSFRMGPA